MHTYSLRGIEVEFPYDAYACQVRLCRCSLQGFSELYIYIRVNSSKSWRMQLDYMERVIQALQEVDGQQHSIDLFCLLFETCMFLVEGECSFGKPYRHRQNTVSPVCNACLA